MISARINKASKMPKSWSDMPFGKQYRLAIEMGLQSWLPKMYGRHLLKLGHLSHEINTDACIISHQFSMGNDDPRFHVLGDPYALPFEHKSIDVCLMINMLTYSDNPHQLLREADRILTDDGWLIISGINPFSLAGLAKCVPILRKKQPYCGRMFSTLRILDWLSILNYEVLYLRSCQLFPWHSPEWWINQHLNYFGALSIIIARKRTCPLTPTLLKLRHTKMRIGNTLGTAKSIKKSY